MFGIDLKVGKDEFCLLRGARYSQCFHQLSELCSGDVAARLWGIVVEDSLGGEVWICG